MRLKLLKVNLEILTNQIYESALGKNKQKIFNQIIKINTKLNANILLDKILEI